MRTGALRCATGVFCALAGSLMLVAPHRLSFLPLAFVDTGLSLWGVAFLIAGVVQLGSIALPVRRAVALLAYIAVVAMIASMAVSIAFDHRWTGAVMCGSLALGLVLPRPTSPVGSSAAPDPAAGEAPWA